ncbi:hypothetical protein, partial [Prevotella intermedia]|uniref:hypothetical protein n=1 Tax=Prevotella intermedia TaxID=28131 RepID=UPI001EE167B8
SAGQTCGVFHRLETMKNVAVCCTSIWNVQSKIPLLSLFIISFLPSGITAPEGTSAKRYALVSVSLIPSKYILILLLFKRSFDSGKFESYTTHDKLLKNFN